MRHAEFISASYQLDTIFPAGKTLKQVQGDVKRKGFTLAEVLITLVVIGIVAAITVPILKQSTEDKQYDAARQKALMTIGQAGRQMAMAGLLNQAAGTTAETFVKDHFSKYVKIAKHCGSNLADCGFVTDTNAITTASGGKTTMPTNYTGLSSANSNSLSNTIVTSHAFTLINGYSVNLFYNPTCTADSKISTYTQGYVCINAVYDMNGKKKPNTVGKDIGFVTVLYPDSTSIAVAPRVYKEDIGGNGNYTDISQIDAIKECSDIDKDLILPTKDELVAMSYNNTLLGLSLDVYWSSSEYSSFYAWYQYFTNGTRHWSNKGSPDHLARCVWR